MSAPRAIGITRTSDTDDRGDRLRTLDVQAAAIKRHAERMGWQLLQPTLDEPDVSGHADLERRPRLLEAIGMLERDDADVIVFAEHDRAFRNAAVQREAVQRVEAAGGELHCVDTGRLVDAGGTDDEWFNGSLHGLLTEKQWRTIRSKSMAGVDAAVAAGQVPGMLIPGLARAKDGSVVIVEREAQAMREAVAMRARGVTLREIRAMLRGRGIDRSQAAVSELLRNRQLLGEHRFGRHTFAVPAIIEDEATFQRAQQAEAPRGRRSSEPRLLSRLGLLRCRCGRRMVVSGSRRHGVRHVNYRCPTTEDCEQRMSISAPVVEQLVADAVVARLADEEGQASRSREVAAIRTAAAEAQARYDAFTDVFDPTETADVERRAKLKAARDAAREREDRLAPPSTDNRHRELPWCELTLLEQRALVSANVAAITVNPGRGAGRVDVQLVGE